MISAVNSCAICSTHKRPADVPWHQHTVGCPVRTGCLCAASAAKQPQRHTYATAWSSHASGTPFSV